MGLVLRNVLMSFVVSMMLLPAVVFASSEYKGTETVNINKANAATLAAYLKGIGPNKAEAIVKYRKANGSFKSVADIKNVPGIGEETYKGLKSKASTSRGKSVAPTGYKLGESSGKSSSSKKKTSSSSSSKKSTSSSSKKSSSSKSDSSSKSSSSKAKKVASDKKSSTAKKVSSSKSKAKKSTTSKKSSTTKKASSKKSTAKKTTKKKKPTKKKTTKKKTSS